MCVLLQTCRSDDRKYVCVCQSTGSDAFPFMPWCHQIDHSRKYHNIPECSLFVTPKVCISFVFSFSWELKWPQEKLKTKLIRKFMYDFLKLNFSHTSQLRLFFVEKRNPEILGVKNLIERESKLFYFRNTLNCILKFSKKKMILKPL